MIENDNIKDLFSKGLENHATPVRPEVWNGLQAKMAAAGVSSAAGVKGLSALAKWIIGGAATSAAVVTTVVIVNSQAPAPQEHKATASAAAPQSAPSTAISDETPQEQTVPVVSGRTAGEQRPQSTLTEHMETPSVPVPLDFGPWQSDTDNTDPDKRSTEPVTTPPPTTSQQDAAADDKHPQSDQQPVKNPETNLPAANESKITKIPNFFSPNNDGDNDLFYIESQHLNDFSVTFLDAQGNAVWSSTDPDFKWDGTDRSGEPVAAGRYICMLVARDGKGELIKEYKFIEIRR